jgi:hypothetical protein
VPFRFSSGLSNVVESALRAGDDFRFFLPSESSVDTDKPKPKPTADWVSLSSLEARGRFFGVKGDGKWSVNEPVRLGGEGDGVGRNLGGSFSDNGAGRADIIYNTKSVMIKSVISYLGHTLSTAWALGEILTSGRLPLSSAVPLSCSSPSSPRTSISCLNELLPLRSRPPGFPDTLFAETDLPPIDGVGGKAGEAGLDKFRGTYDGEGAWDAIRVAVVDMVDALRRGGR